MAETFDYLRMVRDSWASFLAKASLRADNALTDIGNDAYKYERASRDVLGFYNDLLGTWIDLFSGKITAPPLKISIPIKQGTATATVTYPLGLTAGSALDRTDLVKVGLPAGPAIPKANVTLTVQPNGDLTIALAGLGAIIVGRYEGLITVQATGAPVAIILVEIV